MRLAGGVSSLPDSLPPCTPTTTQPAFAVSGESAVMLNSIAKVSHDLSTRAPPGIRQPRGRGVHDAVRDRADGQPGAAARPRRRRTVSFRRGGRLPRLLRARRAAGAALAHHVHLGADDADTPVARLGDGDLVQLGSVARLVA